MLSLDPAAAETLLDALASPHHSLASIAQAHNISLAALLGWLHHPETRARLATRESAAYTHVRYVGAMNLSTAVHSTVKALETFNATPRPADPLDPLYLRAANNARKAAWLLFRFSRLTPLSPAALAPARQTLLQTADATPPTPQSRALHAPTHAQAATPTQPQPQLPAQANPHPAPPPALPTSHARPSETSARAAETSPETLPEAAPHALPHAAPEPAHTEPAPAELDELLTQLTQLATQLGIDPSEFDDAEPLETDLAGASLATAMANTS
ncbi:MAG: hypothetical protein KF912_00740 [Phycisphaeraceae bacterium]|nr:hypothetical protein [Phycisphaeraceae bacterium]MBX3365825.1 hypothetical protein [Phycisphaeraceae bacterium]